MSVLVLSHTLAVNEVLFELVGGSCTVKSGMGCYSALYGFVCCHHHCRNSVIFTCSNFSSAADRVLAWVIVNSANQ